MQQDNPASSVDSVDEQQLISLDFDGNSVESQEQASTEHPNGCKNNMAIADQAASCCRHLNIEM